MKRKGGEKRPPRAFSPSLAGVCLRYAAMELLRFGRNLDEASRAVMQEGARRHRRFQAELLQSGDLIGVEQVVKDDVLGVSGRMDAVCRVHGEPEVVEFKTVDGERFEWIRQHGPPVSHFAQLSLYLELTGYERGVLVVESRASDERTEFVVPRDERWGTWLTERIRTAVVAAREHRLPQREVSVNCLTCDRWQRCFPDPLARDAAARKHPDWAPTPPLPGDPGAEVAAAERGRIS